MGRTGDTRPRALPGRRVVPGSCPAELWGRRGTVDPLLLSPSDVVKRSVEGIATVRNRVVAGLSFPPIREARSRSIPRIRKLGD